MNFRELPSGEESSVEFLQHRGVLPSTRICGNGHNMRLYFGKEIYWKCTVKACQQKVGMRVGNWFEGSRMPFESSILFIYGWAKQWTSIKWCSEELGLSQPTAVDYNNFMREICSWRLQQNQAPIGGPSMIVEVDESLFTKRKNHAGRILPQQWVFGGICRDTKEVFLELVTGRSAATLLEVILRRIHPQSTVISDSWRAYNGLQDAGFNHLRVNHTYNFVDPSSGAHTQTVERMWRSSKMKNKQMSGTNRDFLQSYMEEYMWRNQSSGEEPFDRILTDMAMFSPPAINK